MSTPTSLWSTVVDASPQYFAAPPSGAVSIQAGGTSDSPFLGPLCKWTTDEVLCYGTVFPITLWVVGFVLAVIVLCLRTGVANEYERLSEWTDSSLVPNSLKSLGRKRRDRIFAKIRTIPLQKLFRKLTLGEEFVGGCAAVGIATLGDLVFLRPVFLRDLGFGVNEKQQIMRSIEKRAQYVEEVHRIGNNTVELVSPTLATVIEEACASNRDNIKYYALKPHEASLRRHVAQAGRRGGGFGSGNGIFSLPSMQSSLAFYPIDQVHSEQVSKLFWDFFRSEFNSKVTMATLPPHISISEGSRRSSRVSKQFYVNTRQKWQEAQGKLVVLRIAFVSTFRRISVKAAPAEIIVNEQFWLAFVMRWSMQQERVTKMKEIEKAKKEARDRLRIQKYEMQLEENRKEVQKMVTTKGALWKVGNAMTATAALMISPLARLFGDRNPTNAPSEVVGRDHSEGEQKPDGSPNNSNSNDDDETSSTPSLDFTMVAYPDESEGVFSKNAEDIVDEDEEMIVIDDPALQNDTEMLELDALAEEWVSVDALQMEALEERYTVEVSFAHVLKEVNSNSDDDENNGGGVQAEVARSERMKAEAASSADADLDMLIVYHTSVAMWNEFVHEFQEGEVGVMVGPRRRFQKQHVIADDKAATEMTAMNEGSYEPPELISASESSQFLVDLHIISNVSTSDRFEEMRRRLLMMRDDTTVDEWRTVQEAQLLKQQRGGNAADDDGSRSLSPSESNASSAFSTPSRSETMTDRRDNVGNATRQADTVTRKKRGARGVSFFVGSNQESL